MLIRDTELLLFDVFGTVVDWHGSIVREGIRIAGSEHPWDRVAVEWANRYGRWTRDVVAGKVPWNLLDQFIQSAGEDVLQENDIDLDYMRSSEMTRTWERLDPWPDSVPALTWIAQRRRIAPLSNANREMMKRLSEHAGLPWTTILGTDNIRMFKPDQRVYQMGYSEMRQEPVRTIMVAAHLYDLAAAKRAGLQTVFVHRPGEETEDPQEASYVDAIVRDLTGLSDLLDHLDLNKTAP